MFAGVTEVVRACLKVVTNHSKFAISRVCDSSIVLEASRTAPPVTVSHHNTCHMPYQIDAAA